MPVGIHPATLTEVLRDFGAGSSKRRSLALRLQRIHDLATRTGHLARFVVFGSFVTVKPDPNDIDVFLLMDDTFDVQQVFGETRLLFDHAAADAHFGASVFWLRRMAAFGGEAATLEQWQIKRDGTYRGIVEIVPDTP